MISLNPHKNLDDSASHRGCVIIPSMVGKWKLRALVEAVVVVRWGWGSRKGGRHLPKS